MTSASVERRNELILQAWAEGAEAAHIAQGLEISPSLVRVIVFRARIKGDPRAVSRRSGGEKCRTVDGPAAIGWNEYKRRHKARKAEEDRARAYAYADGSAWS